MKISALMLAATLLIGFPIASTAGVAPDADGDGTPDVLDNCVLLPQGGAGQPGFCDGDGDGYGNACDADTNQDGFLTGADVPIFGGVLLGDPDTIGADTNCDGFLTGADVPIFGAALLSGVVGPGLPCANIMGNPCP